MWRDLGSRLIEPLSSSSLLQEQDIDAAAASGFPRNANQYWVSLLLIHFKSFIINTFEKFL